jgi:thiamine pyrophosphokinase
MAMTNSCRVLILANGDPPSAARLASLVAEHDLLLTTDGAARKAQALGQRPDIISGDFDSLSLQKAQSEFPLSEIIPTPDQNYGDLEKAIGIARERGATAITMTGATGGRLDHTLGAVALLLSAHPALTLSLVDDISETRAVSSRDNSLAEWAFPATPGDIVSIVSFDGRARATLEGVQWPLRDHLVPIGTLGISNRAIAERVVIQVHGGAVIVCHQKHSGIERT